MRIYKQLLFGSSISVDLRLPKTGLKILSVGMQDDQIAVWYIHDDEVEEITTVNIEALNTNEEFLYLDDMNFLGTVTSSTGIVWHVFWKEKRM